MPEHRKVHQGRNIRRFREMLNLKQEAIDDAILRQVSQILKIPVETVRRSGH